MKRDQSVAPMGSIWCRARPPRPRVDGARGGGLLRLTLGRNATETSGRGYPPRLAAVDDQALDVVVADAQRVRPDDVDGAICLLRDALSLTRRPCVLRHQHGAGGQKWRGCARSARRDRADRRAAARPRRSRLTTRRPPSGSRGEGAIFAAATTALRAQVPYGHQPLHTLAADQLRNAPPTRKVVRFPRSQRGDQPGRTWSAPAGTRGSPSEGTFCGPDVAVGVPGCP